MLVGREAMSTFNLVCPWQKWLAVLIGEPVRKCDDQTALPDFSFARFHPDA